MRNKHSEVCDHPPLQDSSDTETGGTPGPGGSSAAGLSDGIPSLESTDYAKRRVWLTRKPQGTSHI